MKCYAVIPAAGQGLRMGLAQPKQFLELAGKPLLLHTVDTFFRSPLVDGVVIAVPEQYLQETRKRIQRAAAATKPVIIVQGGAQRQHSVWNGIMAVPQDCEWVMIHDGVRPFVTHRLIEKIWTGAQETGAAICALPSTDTVKRSRNGYIAETVPRKEIWLAQTPQVFRKSLLLEAYALAERHQWRVTDDASLVERLNIQVKIVEGERTNIKVTTPDDLQWARWCLQKTANSKPPVNPAKEGQCA